MNGIASRQRELGASSFSRDDELTVHEFPAIRPGFSSDRVKREILFRRVAEQGEKIFGELDAVQRRERHARVG
jgi:hypothetical protein